MSQRAQDAGGPATRSFNPRQTIEDRRAKRPTSYALEGPGVHHGHGRYLKTGRDIGGFMTSASIDGARITLWSHKPCVSADSADVRRAGRTS